MVLVPCPTLPDDYEHIEGEDKGEGDEGGRRARGEAKRGEWVRRAREVVVREMEASAGMEGFGESLVGEEVYAPWDWRDR